MRLRFVGIGKETRVHNRSHSRDFCLLDPHSKEDVAGFDWNVSGTARLS